MAEPLAGYRLCAVVAHPDDEAWAMGGTLAGSARYGCVVDVICATRGEAGGDRTGTTSTPAELAALRTAELAASCRALGARPPIHLDLPDSRLPDVPRDDVLARLADHLSALRPHAILTLGADGGYGNVDHLELTGWVDEAGAAVGARVLHAAFPAGLLYPIWRGFRNAGAPWVRKGMAADSFGCARGAAGMVLDTSPWRDAKRAALACHASQVPAGGVDSFLRPGVMEPLWDEEWFVHAAGPELPEGAGHPFDGLPR